MRIIQIITILFSVGLLVFAGQLAVSPPEPQLAEQADFVEVAAPAAPVTPEPVTPAGPTGPAAPVVRTGPAAFVVEGLDYDPADEPEPLANINIVFKLTNTGGERGTYKAAVKIVRADNPGVAVFTWTEDITLAGGESKLVEIPYKTGAIGLYLITLGDLEKKLNVAIF